jgi:hypothetical protein
LAGSQEVIGSNPIFSTKALPNGGAFFVCPTLPFVLVQMALRLKQVFYQYNTLEIILGKLRFPELFWYKMAILSPRAAIGFGILPKVRMQQRLFHIVTDRLTHIQQQYKI